MGKTLEELIREGGTPVHGAPRGKTYEQLMAEGATPVDAPPTSDIGRLESLGQGIKSGGTLGFAGEIAGGTQALLQRTADALPVGALEWAGIDNRYSAGDEGTSDVYRAARNAEQSELDAARAANPGWYLGGEIVGGLAAPLPGGSVAGAAAKGLRTTVAQGAKLGAKQGVKAGALAGLGHSEADLTQGEVGAAAVDTGAGALAGGLLGTAVGGASPAVRFLAQKVKDIPGGLRAFAGERAVKSTQGATQSMLDRVGLTSAEKVQRVGGDLIDQGVVTIGARPKDILLRSKALARDQGKNIGDALTRAGEAGRFRWDAPLEKARGIVTGLNAAERRSAGEAVKHIDDMADEAWAGGSFEAANALKSAINKGINRKLDPPLKTELSEKTVGVLNDEIEAQLRKKLGDEASGGFANAKQLYGSAKTAERLAKMGIKREQANRSVSPSDYGVGGAGMASAATATAMMTGSPVATVGAMVGGAMLGGVNKLARTYGNQTLAVGANAMSKFRPIQFLAKTDPAGLARLIGDRAARAMASAFAEGGEQKAAIAHYMLTQTSPEYRNGLATIDEDGLASKQPK